jgi:hypothetical protein
MTERSMNGFRFQEGREDEDGIGWSGKGIERAGSGG